ncbi:MAG TPA: choice-of-anchor Q domain-containing protein, partial [Thermoanaerobaculia bacterium]
MSLARRWHLAVGATILACLPGPLADPAWAQAAGPRLLFTDIESGPAIGGEGGLGAFITLYGEGFGATQGSSTVTLGGRTVARVVSWAEDAAARGLDRIVVQPGPGAVSGDLVVNVDGQASNPLPFTVRDGTIYFVNQATGNDGNPGSNTQPWASIWRARTTLAAGDIVYVEGGTFGELDPATPGWDTLLFLDTSLCATGTASAPIAYIGYPGRPPLLANPAARRGIFFNQDAGPLSHYIVGNIRFGEMSDSIIVTGIGHRVVGNDLSRGGEGHKVGVAGDTSSIDILGNLFDSNGTPTTKFYSIYVQGFGVNRDIDIGWNEIRNQEGRSIQVYGHLTGDVVDDLRIHDNVLVGSELNNLLVGGSDGDNEILGRVSITGNVIAGSRSAEGLRVNDPTATVIIENNTLVGNAVAQVYLEDAGAGRVTLRNNIIVAEAGEQYYAFDAGSGPASIVSSSNLVHGAGPCESWDTACVSGDPLFVGASDYHLQSGSPAIDRGVPTSASRDHEGTPRPQGPAYDIGAYERQVASSCVAPSITTQPGNRTAAPGTAITLTVTATGTPPLSFQWYQGVSGTTTFPVAGATESTFITGPLAASTSYWVQVSNGCGTRNSDTASIKVTAQRRRTVRRVATGPPSF